MAGSHRAPRRNEPARGAKRPSRKKAPPKLSPRAIGGAVVIALIPAVWFGAQKLVVGSDEEPNSTPQPEIPAATSAGPKTPAATPDKPSSPLPKVAASVSGMRLAYGGRSVGFDDSIEPRDGGFTAASTAEAARWDSRGKPASPGTDTVYFVGKVYRAGDAALNRLPAVAVGDKLTVTTGAGVLTYTVQSAVDRPAQGLLKNAEFTARTPGRLVVVGILFDAGDDERTGKYRVVVAQLTGARRS